MDNKNIINKLNGTVISSDMATILNKLDKNINVNLDEINNTYEIQEALTILNSGKKVSIDMFEKRVHLHDNIVSVIEKRGSFNIDEDGHECYNGVILKDNRIDFVIGLPGSGKSSTLVNPLSKEFKSRIIDSDNIKELFPEYNNGWGASNVHEESKRIALTILSHSLSNKENIVVPIVGCNLEKMINRIDMAVDNGYKVYIHYNELPFNIALSRTIKRFLYTGRFIEPEVTFKYNGKITNVFCELIKNNNVSGYSHWDNNVDFGVKPKLISSTCEGKIFEANKNMIRRKKYGR